MHGRPSHTMAWIQRLSLAGLAMAAFGLAAMIGASALGGWSSIRVFAGGLVLAAGGALTSLLLSLAAACRGGSGRRRALLEAGMALLLLAVVALLWRAA